MEKKQNVKQASFTRHGTVELRRTKNVSRRVSTRHRTWMDTLLHRLEAMMPCQLLSYTTLSWIVKKSESSWGSYPAKSDRAKAHHERMYGTWGQKKTQSAIDTPHHSLSTTHVGNTTATLVSTSGQPSRTATTLNHQRAGKINVS